MTALIDDLVASQCVDPKRVFATGFSMGGGMTNVLACRLADRFAAVAPVAGNHGETWGGTCAPSRPVPIMAFHGTQDSFLPYMEDGTILLVGATTENPSFELNAALLSRARVLVFHSLDAQAIDFTCAAVGAGEIFGFVDLEDGLQIDATAALKDPKLALSIWQKNTAIMEKYNEPGRFTAFIGYEWTSNAGGGDNLHRNVIYRDGKDKADQAIPMTTFDSENPEDLWKWMAEWEKTTGGKLLAIPHNGNLSNGRMFELVDFAGKPGSDVVAVASGVVTYAGELHGYGRMIEINHGAGYITRYGHHDELLVAAGDVVKKGQVIGRMGSTGRSTGPHVHFEVLKDGHPVDPARYIARTRQT